jgi:YidC/Oxa1 family membrane protein insertase
MWSFIWHTFFFDPIYNGLIVSASIVPNADVGLAIIVVTIALKVILLPLSIKAAHTQLALRTIEPELNRIKEQYKDNREESARRMMTAYKEAGINPLSSVFLTLLQIPILIALYITVYSGGGVKLPEVNTALLYSFVVPPETLNMLFGGVLDITQKSMWLAALAGVTQYISGVVSLPPMKEKTGTEVNFKEDLMRSMQLQMKYAMPAIIVFAAYAAGSAVALYFIVTNVASVIQEYVVRRHVPNRHV